MHQLLSRNLIIYSWKKCLFSFLSPLSYFDLSLSQFSQSHTRKPISYSLFSVSFFLALSFFFLSLLSLSSLSLYLYLFLSLSRLSLLLFLPRSFSRSFIVPSLSLCLLLYSSLPLTFSFYLFL